jgi:O-antigen/teichoic acid export membrane protein
MQSVLDRKFSRGVRDNVVAECLVQGVRLCAMVLLARALGAAEFGLFRVLIFVSMFSISVLQPGLTEALVQRKDLTPAHESTAWWVSVALGLAGACLLYAGAPVIAWLMAMPGLTAGVRLVCLPVLLDCLAVTSNAFLQRELRFGILAAADVTGEVVFLAVALGLLWTPLRAWSLMAGLAARVAGRAIILITAAPRIARARPTIGAMRDLRNFATTVWGGSLLSLVSSNADFLLIGRLLGASTLGFYMLAWDLLRFVPDRLYKVAGRVTFPAFCQLQDDNVKLARSYLSFFQYIARIVLPVAACAAVAAPDLIGTIYGARWLPAALPLRMLSVGLALVGLRTGIGSVYWAKGRPSVDIYLHSARLGLIVGVVCGLAHFGLVGISAAMSAVEGLISIAGLLVAAALVGLRLRDLVFAALPAAWLALGCALAAAAGKALAMLCGVSGPMALALIALPPAAVFILVEGATVTAMVAGAFNVNKVADAQLS